MPLCDIIRLGDRSLGRVLHFPVAKGPVFARGIYKADENVGFRDFSFDVNVIGDSPVEFLLYFDRSSSNPGDLNEDDVTRVLNAQVLARSKPRTTTHRLSGCIRHQSHPSGRSVALVHMAPRSRGNLAA